MTNEILVDVDVTEESEALRGLGDEGTSGVSFSFFFEFALVEASTNGNRTSGGKMALGGLKIDD